MRTLLVYVEFREFVARSDRASGLSAAGRSSKDPATACKAEEKKRRQGARIVTQGNAAADNSVGNLCASGLHARAYSCRTKKRQPPAYVLADCMKRDSASINPPATSPQNAPEMPAKETPDAVTRKVIAAASRDSGA